MKTGRVTIQRTTVIIAALVLAALGIGLYIYIRKKEDEKAAILKNIDEILQTKSGVDPSNPDINKGLIGIAADQGFDTKSMISILKQEADAWWKDYNRVLLLFKGKTKPQLAKLNQDLISQEGYTLNDFIFNKIFSNCYNSFGYYVGLGCTELQQIITIING
jgi:hypothetical protein